MMMNRDGNGGDNRGPLRQDEAAGRDYGYAEGRPNIFCFDVYIWKNTAGQIYFALIYIFEHILRSK